MPVTLKLLESRSKIYRGVNDAIQSRHFLELKAAYSGFPFGASFCLLASSAHIPVDSC